MTMTITSVAGRSLVLTKPSFPTLVSIADQFWAMVTPRSNARARTQEAIEILRDATASAERCEWAERYLCGMVGANESRY